MVDAKHVRMEAKAPQGVRLGAIEMVAGDGMADARELDANLVAAAGVDLNAADYDGRTALHLAASDGQLEIVNYLIDKGVNLDPVDRWGGTPLIDAERGGHNVVAVRLKEVSY